MTGTESAANVPVKAVKPAEKQDEKEEEKRRKKNTWAPPTTRKEFEERLGKALTDCDDAQYLTNVGLQCWTFMDRVWKRRTQAAKARSKWDWLRYAGAVIPVVAAGAGGSLVGHLHGLAGTIIGWVALVGGLAGAAVNAVRPAVEYGIDVTKAADFEQLYWDVFNYAMTELPKGDRREIPGKLDDFAQRMEKIALTSGGSTATSS